MRSCNGDERAVVRPGLDVLESRPDLVAGKRVGLLVHPASATSACVHAVDVVARLGGRIQVLLGPEHGVTGHAQDMEPVDGDASSGCRVVSLYGDTETSLVPPADVLSELDVLVIDLQDVGARYYTFVWTAVLCLRACVQTDTPVVVLDRPNPLGGVLVEGPPQAVHLSFVGLLPVAVRHGLTIGEICRWEAARLGAEALLTVVPAAGWRRSLLFCDTGLAWIPPSPNMPTFETALVYPGMCLVEGTTLSEGRGTTTPFLVCGAPGVDGRALAALLQRHAPWGIHWMPVAFVPQFHKHAGAVCSGVRAVVYDPRAVRPYATGLAVLWAFSRCAAGRWTWRREPYEFVSDVPAIDLLTGDDFARTAIDEGADLDVLLSHRSEEAARFAQDMRGYWLYPA